MNAAALMSVSFSSLIERLMMIDSSNLDAIRNRAHKVAITTLAREKGRHGSALSHRAFGSMVVRPSLLLQMLVLPLVFCAMILWLQPILMIFWRACILYWSSQLDLPLQPSDRAVGEGLLALHWTSVDRHLDVPNQMIWLTTAALCLVAFMLSAKFDKEKLPLKYIVRILCFVQTLALIFFLIAPAQFPYTIMDHVTDIVHVGYVLLCVIPIMLALGFYPLNVHPLVKVLHTLLILAYFVVMIPYQVVLHALILHHFSLLFMPILYICFGATFDVLIFVGLYSWAASTLPPSATS